MDIFGGLKNFLIDTINTIMSILPSCPFEGVVLAIENNQILNAINWFIPIKTFVVILGFWLYAIGSFYGWSVVLRWVKAIE